ncbi:limbic system-associated membrane protein-like [Anneissia japonica]|uniref:limbic system-associated membrane protein-like n=1 Tax=Anneissia japonica TaxID=1529436 RepID=UPI0014257D5A|nr:limbic system-associated membrane protein-like [Anneissia japonica]
MLGRTLNTSATIFFRHWTCASPCGKYMAVIHAILNASHWNNAYYYITDIEKPDFKPDYQTVSEGGTAIFICTLPNGFPTPITITWIKDGSVCDVSDTEKYPQSDTIFEISSVNKTDEGRYQCRAENAEYSGDEGKLSNTGKLSVNYKPEFSLAKEDTVLSYETYVIELDVSANPSCVTYQWTTDPSGLEETDTNLAIFKVNVRKRKDKMFKITVNVTNIIGSTTKSSKITVNRIDAEAAAIIFIVVGCVCIVCGAIAVICGWLLNNRIWIGILIVFDVLLLVGGIILFVVSVDVAAIIVVSCGCIYMLLAVGSVLCFKCGIFEKQKDALKEKEWFKNVDFRIMLGWAFLAAVIPHIIVGVIYVVKTT